jgi:hypothetical protein
MNKKPLQVAKFQMLFQSTQPLMCQKQDPAISKVIVYKEIKHASAGVV